MSDKSKLLSEQEAKEARERGKRYIESCAIEGLEFPPDMLAYIKSLEEQRLNYDEIRAKLFEWLENKWKTKEGK